MKIIHQITRRLGLLLTLPLLSLMGCSYNPMIPDNHTTGSPIGAAVGAGIGAGGVAAIGGPKLYMGLAGIGGGMIGYYVTTLRYASGGVISGGGQVFQIGDYVGIYIPTDNLFEPNTADFTPQANAILDSAAAILERYPNNNILISGNTSGFGRPKWERSLSLRRARAVSSYLWNAGINNFKNPGIDMRKLEYVGYGDYFPISSTLTNKGLRSNSRIQITSYPSNADLNLDRRHLAVHNVGALKDEVGPAQPVKCGVASDASGCFVDD